MTMLYMLESTRGSPDAHAVVRYMQGKHYDVPDSLAAKFLNDGVAMECPEQDVNHGMNGIRLEEKICGICGKGESEWATYHLPNCPKAEKLSSNVTLHTLPTPITHAMDYFNAGREARKAVGEPDICAMD